jgi:hypothetical protein
MNIKSLDSTTAAIATCESIERKLDSRLNSINYAIAGMKSDLIRCIVGVALGQLAIYSLIFLYVTR